MSNDATPLCLLLLARPVPRVARIGPGRRSRRLGDRCEAGGYDIGYGGGTTRCPSLVQECPGAQFNDPYNDVGWLALGGTTLGVTWYTTSDPEADMALNTRF